MSVSDPLLKKIKGYIHQMRMEKDPITDLYPTLQPFCETLEEIFRRGLREHKSLFGMFKKDYWNWIELLNSDDLQKKEDRVNPLFGMVVSRVKSCGKCCTNQGKGRYFLRLALQNKILCVPVEQINKSRQLVEMWYDPYSIIGDEILHEILLSLLYEVTEINFNLCTNNATFLDETWLLSIYKTYEFVPCRDLGIQAQFVKDRSIVCKVRPGSVAEEDGKIEVGDILEELLGQTLRGIKKGRMGHLLKQNQGYPITLSVIKSRLPDGKVYPPLRVMLEQAGKEAGNLLEALCPRNEDAGSSSQGHRIPPHAQLPEDELDEVPVHNTEDRAGYYIKYIGKVHIGSCGGVHFVEKAIDTILKKKTTTEIQQLETIFMELGETDVLIKKEDTKEVLFKHSYTEISACGRRTDCTDYFAYIVGETTCTMAKNFAAHIFKAKCDEESKTILCSIAQGFGRTHWYV